MLRGHPMPVQVCWPALASSSSRGDARFALCRAYNARSLRNKRPTPGPGPLCPQRFWSSVTFSGDQSLLSLSLSLLYFNKTLLHKSTEWSCLISGPRLNSSPPEAKNPSVFLGSTTIFQWLKSDQSSELLLLNWGISDYILLIWHAEIGKQ